MESLVAIDRAVAEQYLYDIIRVNENVHAVLLCILDNGYYTSVGYAEQLYTAAEEKKIVIYNAAGALDIPFNWKELKTHKAFITVKDDGFTITCTEETFDIVDVDFTACRDMWTEKLFTTVSLPSVYTLSDGSCVNMIALDL